MSKTCLIALVLYCCVFVVINLDLSEICQLNLLNLYNLIPSSKEPRMYTKARI